MSGLMFVVLVLCSYRLTRLVAVDDLTEPLRQRVPPGRAFDLVTCVFCVGVWVSILVVLFAANTVLPLHWEWVALTCAAVAGGQALCSSVDGRLND